MKRLILSGLAALVLGSGVVGCGNRAPQTPPNNVGNTSSATATALPPKPDLTLKLDDLRGLEDPTLIVNNELHYLFVRSNGRYRLRRIEPYEKTELVLQLSDPNRDTSLTMDLGEYGRLYNLSYNPEVGDYQISPR